MWPLQTGQLSPYDGHDPSGAGGHSRDTRRAVQLLVAGYDSRLKLDQNVTVHSFRVTALTTAQERGRTLWTRKTSPATPTRGPPSGTSATGIG